MSYLPARCFVNHGYYCFVAALFIFVAWPGAVRAESLADFQNSTEPKAHFFPFVPQQRDYGLELGAMFEQNNLYWLGGYMGFHMGPCWLSTSETCQQYIDAIGGAGGREGLTIGTLFAALRWQFVKVPVYFSPSLRLLVGAMNIRDDHRDRTTLAGGLGYGITTSVHERVDLKIEARAGYSDQFWSQVFLGVNLKMDRWVDYFAKKLQKLGEDTVKAPVKVFDWVAPQSTDKSKPRNENPDKKTAP